MIIQQVPNDRPQAEKGQAVAQDVALVTVPKNPLDPYCLCDIGFKECEYREPAFYGGSNEFENDYKTIFVNKVDSSDVISFFLIDLQLNVELELRADNASMYGEYLEGANYCGVIINFDTLINQYNANLKYVNFRTEQEVFGDQLATTSHEYDLLKFSQTLADGTVRIETVNSGRIESGNDYDDLSWKRSVRIAGFFGRESPTLSIDNYQDGDRTIKQIQDKIENEYTLETELIPNQIFKAIMFNDMLANKIIVSDYNLRNTNYKGVEVSPRSVASNYYEKNPNGSYEITFTDRVQNIVKRNV